MKTLSGNEVAIIGMSGLFPEAETLEDFFINLKEGKDSVRSLSRNRLTDVKCDPDKKYRPIGFLQEVDKFDHQFFGMSKSEAEAIDPVQRILLELVYTAFENGGHGPADFKGKKIGVFIGGLGSNYHYLSEQSDAVSIIGNTTGIIAGRIAYLLDLRGPVMMIDTTCSSALTAIYEGYKKITAGEIDCAIVGSVNIQLFFSELDEVSPLNTLSSDGKCRPFDASANGIGSGEGGGILFLKKLDMALRDKDPIHATIKGGAINSDGGLSNGLTAPSPEAQKNVILEAWKHAGISPETISYIETHGTGTKLGDPIEFQALTDAFKVHTQKKKICPIGAVKSNLGHLDHAAAMAGIIKTILSLKHKKLFPTVHFKNPNPFLNHESSALFVNTEYKHWNSPEHPRRAGISAFGLSGTNVHMILEEAPQQEESTIPLPGLSGKDLYYLQLSARSEQSLAEYKRKVKDFLKANADKDWDSILYTLNSCRGDYEYFFSCLAYSKEEILERLASGADGYSVKKGQPRLSVLLSDEGLNDDLVSFLEDQLDTIRDIRSLLLSGSADPDRRIIADQLACLVFLDHLKIPVERMIVTGIGRVTQRLYNDMSLISQVDTWLHTGLHKTLPDHDKLGHTINSILQEDKEPVFFSLSENCKLYEFLKNNDYQSEDRVCIGKNLPLHSLLPVLSFFTSKGLPVQWKNFYRNAGYYKVEAPTYPFQRIRCWFSEQEQFSSPIMNASTKIAVQEKDRLFETQWILDKAGLPALNESKGKIYIVFPDKSGLAEELLLKIRGANTAILAEPGTAYEKKNDFHYVINVRDEGSYQRLRNSVVESFGIVNGIIHLGSYDLKDAVSGNLESTLSEGVYAAFFAAKAFSKELDRSRFEVGVATSELYNESQEKISSGSATWGFWKGILSDYPHLQLSAIDFNEAHTIRANAEILWNELQGEHSIRFARYKEASRYIEEIIPLTKFKAAEKKQTEPGVYIISGGLGRIGRHIAQHLAKPGNHLILLGQSAVEGESKKLCLENIKRSGGTYEYHKIDIASDKKMESLFQELYTRHTKINGVLHLAGVADDWSPLPVKMDSRVYKTIMPKVAGTLILDKYAGVLHPDFFVCFSSLNAIIPKKYSFDYAAANAFEDHISRKYAGRGNTNYISINWPGWNVFENEPPSRAAVNPDEGCKILDLILQAGQPNVIVADRAGLEIYSSNPFFLFRRSDEAENQQPSVKDDGIKKQEDMPLQLLTLRDIESDILKIWYEVLRADQISEDDDFFEIGGHSLNGTQVLNRIHKRFGVEIDMDELFDYATVKTLSAYVESKLVVPGSAPVIEADKIHQIATQEYYPASDIQSTFWVNSQLQEGTRVYNMVLPFFIKGELNRDALENTMQTLIRRHESLRTQFVLIDGQLKQHVLNPASFAFGVRYEKADHSLSWGNYPQREHDTHFDLTAAPLIKALLVEYEKDYHLFILTIHHIIADGWSWGIILNEFIKLYESLNAQKNPSLPELSIQYKDYVAWLNGKIATEGKEHELYWKDKLAGEWPRLGAHVAAPDYSNSQWKAGILKISLSEHQTKSLKELAIKKDVTLFMLLTAIFKMFLFRQYGWEDIVVGTVTSGRIHPDLENQVGNYLNTLALRDAVAADMQFPELLDNVRQTTMEAYKHQLYPFTRIIEDKLAQGYEWQERWLDIQVNLHNYLQGEDFIKAADLLLELPVETQENDFDTDWNLHFNCTEPEKDKLKIYINYSMALFSNEETKHWIAELSSIIMAVITNPDQSVRELACNPINIGYEEVVEQKKELLNAAG